MNSVYDYPRYYEIAFSFRDIPAEVDTFEACIEKYAERSVEHVLEIGCGNSPHITELLKKGYAYTGLDISQAMLAYSTRKATALDGKATFVQANMNDFSLAEKFDFAYITLGSLSAANTQNLFSHFHSVAGTLHQGGLYLLDWCVQFSPFSDREESWIMEQDQIKVTTCYSEKTINPAEQLVEERIAMEVIDNGSVHHLEEIGLNRVMFPQEFLQIIQNTGEYDFVGWWNNWNLDQPLHKITDPKEITRPIILLRKE
jgi:SAM-dependent methyltransferase